MSDLEWKKLSEVVELVIDNRGRNPKAYFDEGIPVIDNYLITSDGEANLGEVNRYIDEETYNSFLRKYITEGDVLMTLVGNGYGKVATTPKERCAIIQNTIGLRCNKDNSNQFLYYLLRNNRESLMNLNRGAAQPSIKVGDVLNLEFGFPPIDRQNRIASILGVIDNKIELNRRINQTLEQIAQAIFKSWFVDFDPVKAKISAKQNGQDPERAAMCAISGKTEEQLDQLNPDQYQQLAATAALFPDELVDSELGEVPRGWEVTTLSAVTSELRRGISPKYIDEGGVLVVNQKCIRNHTIDFSLCRRNDPIKKKVEGRELKIGDVLVNSTGVGTLGRLAPVRYLTETTVADSHVTVIRREKNKVTFSFLAGLLLSKESYIENSGAGSTGQTELRREVLEEIKFSWPSYQVQIVFENIIRPMHELIAQNEQQQKALAVTRDSLLPRLLSGEMALGETQSTTEVMV